MHVIFFYFSDKNDRVDITSFNIPSDVFHLLLDFMYTGELSTHKCDIVQGNYM